MTRNDGHYSIILFRHDARHCIGSADDGADDNCKGYGYMSRLIDSEATEKEMLFWADTYGYGGLTKDNIREILRDDKRHRQSMQSRLLDVMSASTTH